MPPSDCYWRKRMDIGASAPSAQERPLSLGRGSEPRSPPAGSAPETRHKRRSYPRNKTTGPGPLQLNRSRIHRDSTEDDTSCAIICRVCERTFRSQYSVLVHMRHHGVMRHRLRHRGGHRTDGIRRDAAGGNICHTFDGGTVMIADRGGDARHVK